MPVLAAIGEGLVELERDGDDERLRLGAGGDAANVLVMAARLGAATRLIGRVGDDPLGAWLRSFWRRAGIDVAHVRRDPDAPTGMYLNVPDHGGHRFVYWRQGSAGSRLEPGDVDGVPFADVGMLVVTGVTLAVSSSSAAAAARAVERARAAGARVACVLNHRPQLGADPAPLAGVAGAADIVVGSVEDSLALFGTADPGELPEIRELVLTDGPRPAIALVDGDVLEQPVPAIEAVNAAGAGDAFAGAYLARRLGGHGPRDALAWGVAASAASVTRSGCAGSYPSLAQTQALLDQLSARA